MKKLIILIIIVIGFCGISKAERIYKTDTIIVEFGNNSKLIIYVESDEDLKELEDYDINAMIAEMNLNIESSEDASYLQITDADGTRFLKDTIVRVSDSKPRYYDDRDRGRDRNRNRDDYNDSYSDNNSRVKIGNIEVDIDDDFFDDRDVDFDNTGWRDRGNERSINKTRNTFEIDLGLNNWLEDGGFPDENNKLYAVKPFGSWYVALRSIQKTSIGGPLFINWGGGVSWYNWKFENANTNIEKGPTSVIFSENTTVRGIKSKLAASYVNVELVPMLDFSYGRRKVKEMDAGRVRITRFKKRGIRIGIGGYAGYRLTSWSKFVFEENGDKDRTKEKSNFFLNNVRYGIRAQIGFKGMDFFANYDLNDVFSSGNNPSLNAISFGITL